MSPRPTLRVAGLALMASLAPLAASTCTASPTYSFTDLGVADYGRLTFDANGTVNPTPISLGDETHDRNGHFSIGVTGIGEHHDILFSTAIADGYSPQTIPGNDGFTSHAYSVNKAGIYVGTNNRYKYNEVAYGAAFTFTLEGGLRLVPTPYPDNLSVALGGQRGRSYRRLVHSRGLPHRRPVVVGSEHADRPRRRVPPHQRLGHQRPRTDRGGGPRPSRQQQAFLPAHANGDARAGLGPDVRAGRLGLRPAAMGEPEGRLTRVSDLDERGGRLHFADGSMSIGLDHLKLNPPTTDGHG